MDIKIKAGDVFYTTRKGSYKLDIHVIKEVSEQHAITDFGVKVGLELVDTYEGKGVYAISKSTPRLTFLAETPELKARYEKYAD